jgi:hypothetical protein
LSKTIDLTGFISEDIEINLVGKTYTIPLDPDVESYVELINYTQQKFGDKEFLRVAKKFIIGIIERNNENVDKKELEKKLGVGAISEFMVKYIEVLMENGVLKKVVTPQKAETPETKSQ